MTLLSENLLSPALSSKGGEGAFPLPAKRGEGQREGRLFAKPSPIFQ
jgi:hypothetical protein